MLGGEAGLEQSRVTGRLHNVPHQPAELRQGFPHSGQLLRLLLGKLATPGYGIREQTTTGKDLGELSATGKAAVNNQGRETALANC